MELPDRLHHSPDGDIRIRGSRIGLFDMVTDHRYGLSAKEIAAQYDSITLDQVRAVLAFHAANRAEVDAYVDREQALIDRRRAEAPPGISLEDLRKRAAARKLAARG